MRPTRAGTRVTVMSAPVLSVGGLTKRFGDLVGVREHVVDDEQPARREGAA